jgi:hypothetical protein
MGLSGREDGPPGPYPSGARALIIDVLTSPKRDGNTMQHQIEELLSAEEPTLARIEDTLTEGYAQALALEAERWRVERRIGEVAREGRTDIGEELRSLGTRLTRADGELTKLRSLLGSLHERAHTVRMQHRAAS